MMKLIGKILERPYRDLGGKHLPFVLFNSIISYIRM